MPARRKPTALLEASGAFIKHPERKNARAHEPEWNGPVGDAPEWFNVDLAEIWEDLRTHAAPGVLARSDAVLLEMTSLLLYKYRRAPEATPRWLMSLGDALRKKGMPAAVVKRMQTTLFNGLRMSGSEMQVLLKCLGSMGMNPKDRHALPK